LVYISLSVKFELFIIKQPEMPDYEGKVARLAGLEVAKIEF